MSFMTKSVQGLKNGTVKVLYTDRNITVLDNGEYILSVASHDYSRAWIQATFNSPFNGELIAKAKRANDLGLNAPVPEPVYGPVEGYAIGGTAEEIQATFNAALESLAFDPALVVGKKSEWVWTRYPSCSEDQGDGYNRYFPEDKVQPGYRPAINIIPGEWFVEWPKSRRTIKVQSSCFKYLWTITTLIGDVGSGSILDRAMALRYGIKDEAVLAHLDKLNAEWGAHWAARRAAEIEDEKARLAKELGLS